MQYAFMVLLLVGVFGIYTELRQLNDMQNGDSQIPNHAVNANYAPVLSYTAFPVGDEMPLIELTSGKYMGKVAIPVVQLPLGEFKRYVPTPSVR